LVDELKPERSLSYSPLFQVAFAMEKSAAPLELPGLTLEWIDIDRGTSKFDLALFVFDKADELSCILEYDTDLFDDATISRMLGHLRTLLEGIVANPAQCVRELPLLTEAEINEFEARSHKTTGGDEVCIHEMFERQVRSAPNAVALVFEDKWLTYDQLNR